MSNIANIEIWIKEHYDTQIVHANSEYLAIMIDHYISDNSIVIIGQSNSDD